MSNGRTLPSCVFPPRDPVKPNLNEKRRTPSDEEREEQKKPPTDESFIAKENETKKTNNTCSNRAGTGESRSPPLCPAPPTPCPLPPSCASRDQRFRKIRKWKREDRSKRKLFFFRWPDKKNKAKKKLEQVRFFFLPVTSFSIPPPVSFLYYYF